MEWWRAGKVPLLDVLKYINLPVVEVAAARANGKWIAKDSYCTGGEGLAFVGVECLRRQSSQPDRGWSWQDCIDRKPTFICDIHARKLARHLRLLGYDTICEDWKDSKIIRQAANDDRIILTRDRELLMRPGIRWGQWLEPEDPAEQLIAVLQRWGARSDITAFSRCMECNKRLVNRLVTEVDQELPKDVLERQYTVWTCPQCDRIYWQGSHYEHMSVRIRSWLDRAF
jgi:uncharacterized protein with PIN domain